MNKKILSIAAAAVLAAGTLVLPATVCDAHGTEKEGISENHVEGQVIVCYADPDDVDMTKKQEKKSEKLLGDAEEIMQKDDETIAVVDSETKSTEKLIDEIGKLPNVDYVEPNYIFKLDEEEQAVEDTEETSDIEAAGAETIPVDYTSDQWAFRGQYGLNVPDWNTKGYVNAEGTVVAVIDSGVDYTHEDLKNVMWHKPENLKVDGFGEYGIDTYYDDSDPMDDYFHGTHCAGIAAAEWGNGGVAGVASGTKIMAVKVSSKSGSISMSSVIDGYEKITEAKKAGVNIVAANNSWGGRVSSATALNDAVTKAGEAGIVSVFASANNGSNCDESSWLHEIPYFIKDNPYKIVVNSIDSDGSMSSFSNYGVNTTDIAAPGRDIMSTLPGNRYGEKSGTSMAAPAVTGEVAAVESIFDSAEYGADVVASIVKGNVNPSASMAGKCSSEGLANLGKASTISREESLDIKYKPISLEYTSCTYDGTEKKPSAIIAGIDSEDYSIDYSDNINTGKATATVTFNGGIYNGKQISRTFNITKATPSVSLSNYYFIYTGGNYGVSVTVRDAGGKVLAEGADYNLDGSLSGNMPGTYSVQVHMKDGENYNNCSDAFRIAVQPTYFQKLSRGKKSFTVKVGKQSKNLISGYQVQYSPYRNMAGAKIKNIGTKYNKTSKKIGSLKKKTVYYVQVRSYRTISGANHYSDWSNIRTVYTK